MHAKRKTAESHPGCTVTVLVAPCRCRRSTQRKYGPHTVLHEGCKPIDSRQNKSKVKTGTEHTTIGVWFDTPEGTNHNHNQKLCREARPLQRLSSGQSAPLTAGG